MKNKFLVLGVILTLVISLFVLSGCGKKDDKNDNTSNSTKNETSDNSSDKKADVLKVGKFTLQYGKYEGDTYVNGTDAPAVKGTYIINEDGTYSYSTSDGKSASGSYKVIDFTDVGLEDVFGLEFDADDSKLTVEKNDTLQVMAGAQEEFTYQGK